MGVGIRSHCHPGDAGPHARTGREWMPMRSAGYAMAQVRVDAVNGRSPRPSSPASHRSRSRRRRYCARSARWRADSAGRSRVPSPRLVCATFSWPHRRVLRATGTPVKIVKVVQKCVNLADTRQSRQIEPPRKVASMLARQVPGGPQLCLPSNGSSLGIVCRCVVTGVSCAL